VGGRNSDSGKPKTSLEIAKIHARRRWPVPADHLPGQVLLHGTKCLELFTVDDGADSLLRFAAYYHSTHCIHDHEM
jgi:hypothetical protein